MKKIIGVLLAVVLVAGGLGGLAYAQTDPNQVHAGFETAYRYRTAGDSVVNPTTDQPTHIHSWLHNNRDVTGDNVTKPILDLSTNQTVTDVKSEYWVPGSTYQWKFPDIPEDEGFGAHADIDEIVEVSTNLTVSRSANQTSFPPTGGTQNLTLTVTPVETMERLEVNGDTDVEGLDIATVTSVSGENIRIKDDGRGFDAWIGEPTANVTYEWEVTIKIGPLPAEYPPVEFEYMPRISVSNVDYIDDGEFYGKSVSGNSSSLNGGEVLGTWTWQATVDYSWRWDEKVSKRIELEGYAEIQCNEVHAGFETSYRYRTACDEVANPTTSERTHLNSWLSNNRDGTGDNVTKPILELSTNQTVTWVRQEYLVSTDPTYRWQFPDIAEDEHFSAHADIDEIVEVSTNLTVSRSANQTRFSPAGGNQTLTLSVTPEEAMDRLDIWGRTDVDGLDIATVTSVSGPGIKIHGDGRGFDGGISNPTENSTYLWQITIKIGELPSDFKALEYMPRINVSNVHFTDSDSFYGGSVNRTTLLGTWSWNATGDYWWHWDERVSKRVEMEGYAIHSYVVAPTEDTVNDAIDAGLEWLRTQQQPDGSWYWGDPKDEERPSVGTTGLALWCFLQRGIAESDATVSAGIDFILSRFHTGHATYETAIAILALRATNNPIYLPRITLLADYLASLQNDEDVVYLHCGNITSDHWAYGGWSYSYAHETAHIWVGGEKVPSEWYVRSDLSCTQFAMIGLKAAQDAGVELTHDTWGDLWARAETYVSRCQNPDGGFTYQPQESPGGAGGSYGSMTAAGVWCLRLSGVSEDDSRVEDGLAWLDCNHFYDRNPPGSGRHNHYYFLWTAAKAFALCDRPQVLEEDTWYYDFAGYLLANQKETGQWLNPQWQVDMDDRESCLNRTEYALLVLEKAVLPPPPPPLPYQLKESAVEELEQLLAEDVGDDDLQQAMDYIHMSLGDERGKELGSEVVWLDAYRIDRAKGPDVFQYEEEAADKMLAYIENDENAGFGFEDVISEIGDKLYNADKQLTEVAIYEAVTAGGNPDDIAKAEEYLQLAEEKYASGEKISAVLDLLEEGWEKAVYSGTPAPYTLRLQSSYPADHLGYQVFESWAQEISEASGGRLRIEPYPAGAIVANSGAFDAVQMGLLDGSVANPIFWTVRHALANYLSSYPFGLDEPYMWETWFYERGGIELAREDYARFNIHYIGPVMGPPEYAHCVKPLYTMEDWDGLKCRYFGGMVGDVFTEAGAEAIMMPGYEICQAMATGVIELGEYSSHYMNKQLGLYEVGPYIIGPGQMHSAVTISSFVVNMDIWNSLPSDLQGMITTGVSDLSSRTLSVEQAADIEALQWMVEYGCEYIEIPAAERAKFRAISVQFWKEYATDATSLQAVKSQILLMSEVGLLDDPAVKEQVDFYFEGLLP